MNVETLGEAIGRVRRTIGEAIGRVRHTIERKGLAWVACSGFVYIGGWLSRHKGLLALAVIVGGVGAARGGVVPEVNWPQWAQLPQWSDHRKIDWHQRGPRAVEPDWHKKVDTADRLIVARVAAPFDVLST